MQRWEKGGKTLGWTTLGSRLTPLVPHMPSVLVNAEKNTHKLSRPLDVKCVSCGRYWCFAQGLDSPHDQGFAHPSDLTWWKT
jgi:hypothetical protein